MLVVLNRVNRVGSEDPLKESILHALKQTTDPFVSDVLNFLLIDRSPDSKKTASLLLNEFYDPYLDDVKSYL